MRRVVSGAAFWLAMLAKIGLVAAVFVVVGGLLTARSAPAVRHPRATDKRLTSHTVHTIRLASGRSVSGRPPTTERPSSPSVDDSRRSTVAGPAQPVTPATPAPAPTPAPTPPPLPAAGASAAALPPDPGPGCQAALAYLTAHAAPGFQVACPVYADGHQATTICDNAPQCVPGTAWIWIADPCPAAYMNEASNSWVLIGQSTAPWDPFGYCGEPGNPYG